MKKLEDSPLSIINSFIKFKLLASLCKRFHGPLDYDNALH